jgi:hypothetical protein
MRYLERDGDKLLLRLAVDDAAVLDVLTDPVTLARARTVLTNAPERGLTEQRLGSFGPFELTMSTTNAMEVAIAVDGPGAFQ